MGSVGAGRPRPLAYGEMRLFIGHTLGRQFLSNKASATVKAAEACHHAKCRSACLMLD